MKDHGILFCWIVLTIAGVLDAVHVPTQNASYTCVESNPGKITMTFFIQENDDFISHICFYDVGDTTDSGLRMCINKTEDPFSISLEADPGGPPVPDTGISMPDNMTISYLLRSVATEPDDDVLTDTFYEFSCSLDNLIPNRIEIDGFNAKIEDQVRRLRSKPKSLYMVACDAETGLPVSKSKIGDSIFLQIYFNRGDGFVGDDTFGLITYVGFLQHDTATCTLFIFSREKTKVKITSLSGSETIDDTVNTYDVPPSFLTGAAIGTMEVGQNGLRVESLFDYAEISVTVKCETADSAAAYVGIPYEVLGTEYHATTYDPVPGEGTQCVVIGTQDDTEVSITFPLVFPNPIVFDGNAFGASEIAQVNISEFETIHIHADDSSLTKTRIMSNKPVAVICGHADTKIPVDGDENISADMIMDAMIPENRIGNRYVLFPLGYISALNDTAFLFHTKVGFFSPLVEGFLPGLPLNMYSTVSLPYTSFGNNSARTIGDGTDPPYHVSQFLPSIDLQAFVEPFDVSFTVWPAIHMWSDSYIWPVRPGNFYRMVVVYHIGTLENIVLQNNIGPSLPGDLLFMLISAPSVVLPIPGGQAEFEIGEGVVQAHPDGKYLSLSISIPTAPFMVVVYEIDPLRPNHTAACSFIPPGLRLPIFSGCMKSNTVHGDGKDNDCDGRLDEEKENFKDDDGDNKVDEDLARASISFADVNGAWTDILDIAPTEEFDGSTVRLISGGCSTRNLIGEFSQFDIPDDPGEKYVRLKTPPFKAFRFAGKKRLFYKALMNFCKGDNSRCLDSCPARKKRSAEGQGVREVDLELTVEPNADIENVTQDMKLAHKLTVKSDPGLEMSLHCPNSPVTVINTECFGPIEADDTGSCGKDIGFLVVTGGLMVLLLLETAFSSAFVIRLKMWKSNKHLK